MVILAGATEGQVYDTLAEAVENAAPESTIRFLEGAELAEWIGVNKELTFDLNGQKVTAAVPFAANQDALFAVNRFGKLTITDSATGGEIDSGAVMCAIKMTQNQTRDYVDPATYTDANKAILVVNGGTIKGFNYAIAGNGNPGRGNTEITINGGTLIASDEGVNLLDKCSCAIYNPSENSTLTINGGDITGYDSAVEIRAGSLTVTGGSLTAKNETYAVKGNGNGPTVTGAALAVSQHTTKKELGATVSEVTGATLTGAKAVAVVNPQLNTTDNVVVELGEATYNGALAYEADGNAVVTDKNSGLAAPAGYDWDNGVLKALVVQIVGGKQYTSLGAAIADLTGTGEETIELLKDYTAADAEILVFAKDATLDLGEFELTLPTALLGAKAFEVSDGASLVLTNGVITMGDNAYGLQVYGTAIVADGCTMTKLVNTKQGPIFDIYGKGTTSTDGGTVLVEAGAYIESGADVFRHKKNGAETKAQANVYVTGGTIKTTHATYGIFNGSSYYIADDIAVITGGTFLGTFEQTEPWGSMAELGADAADVRFDTKATASAAKHLADGYEFAEAEEDGLWKIVKSPVAEIVGGGKYGTLGEAIAALTGGETIKLLANYTTTENLAFNKTCTLDLNEKTLMIPGDYRGKPLAASASSTAYTGVDAGATLTVTNGSVVLAEKNAGGKVNYGFYVVGKLINYANWTHDNTSGPAIELYEGAEVVQNDGVLTSGDIFRSKDDVQAEAIRTITINGGTMTATGNNAYSYPIIYFTKSGTHNITINGGTFETAVYAYGVAGDTTNISGLDGDCQAKFKNTVITVSGAKTDLSAYVAEGYELVKGGDEYYTIAKIPSFDVTFTQNTTEAIGSTNVLRGTALTADMIPAVEGGTWDVDPVGAVITSNTNFNYTVAVGPEWPEDWPADVPPAMKEAFKTWADTYKVDSFEGVENAFLMNVDPNGTIPALEITSIEVADGVATIKVAAGEKNLKEGINGVLFVSATDDLAGEWATIAVEEPKSYEDEGLTAVFEVEGANFMKAKVGFKVETPVVKEN